MVPIVPFPAGFMDRHIGHQLGRETAETDGLLRRVQTSQTERNRQENTLSAELNTALKQATGASQKALQATQTEILSSLL